MLCEGPPWLAGRVDGFCFLGTTVGEVKVCLFQVSSGPQGCGRERTMSSQARSCLYGFHSTISTFGFPCKLSTICFNALVIGGCGFTTPSSQRTPTFSFFPLKKSSSFHGKGSKDGSLYQGFASIIVLMNNLQLSRLVDRGPIVGTICSSPNCVAVNPFIGRRPDVGFMP